MDGYYFRNLGQLQNNSVMTITSPSPVYAKYVQFHSTNAYSVWRVGDITINDLLIPDVPQTADRRRLRKATV